MFDDKYSWELNTKERAELEAYLLSYNGEDRAITSFDARDQMLTEAEATVTLRSGLPTLDSLTEGYRGGELVVITGPTGNGKTSLARMITMSLNRQGSVALWFSYEERKKQFIRKFAPLPFFTLPNALEERATKWIDKRVLEHKIKHEVKAVFIDHLHYLIDMERMKQPSLEIGTIARNLKRIAIAQNIVIFLIAHVQKLVDDREPDTNSIRDSGMIACEADTILMVWREKMKGSLDLTNKSIVKVCKCRQTGAMEKKVHLVMINGMLQEEANV